jgi:hypothetical protein
MNARRTLGFLSVGLVLSGLLVCLGGCVTISRHGDSAADIMMTPVEQAFGSTAQAAAERVERAVLDRRNWAAAREVALRAHRANLEANRRARHAEANDPPEPKRFGYAF